MAALILEWDKSQIEGLLKGGMEKALFRALSMSGGDAIRAARVASSRTIRFRKRFKVSRVNGGLKLRFPRTGTRLLENLEWRVDASGEVVPLTAFPFKAVKGKTIGRKGRRERTEGGVKVAINRGRWGFIPNAFVARMKSNHVGIFVRKGRARLPIEEKFTTRISDVFEDHGMVPAVHARAQVVFSSSFSRLLPIQLAKMAKK